MHLRVDLFFYEERYEYGGTMTVVSLYDAVPMNSQRYLVYDVNADIILRIKAVRYTPYLQLVYQAFGVRNAGIYDGMA